MEGILTCDRKCQYINNLTTKTWLCNGVCQTVTKPCQGKCPQLGHTYLNCNGTCEETPSVFQCQDQCQSVHLPCNQTTCFNAWDHRKTTKEDTKNETNTEPIIGSAQMRVAVLTLNTYATSIKK